MPRYLRLMDSLIASGHSRVSSSEIGEKLGFTPSQVRQDFSNFGEFGQQGYGYNVKALREQIAGILGTDRGYKAVLLGVGHIGRALMGNFCFSEWGFNLVHAFDVDSTKIGTEYRGVAISDMKELDSYLQSNPVDVAVLTVPKDVAVEVARHLSTCGVRAIWNFTNVELFEPGTDVIVENMHFSDSLLSLGYFISERQDEEEKQKK